jgi:P-type Cu+ transporter
LLNVLLGTAESSSEHPLALAVRNYCRTYFGTQQLGHCQDFKATWGYGLQARVSKIDSLVGSSCIDTSRIYSVLIGNREWMKRNRLTVNDTVDNAMSVHEQEGHTAILVAIDSKTRQQSIPIYSHVFFYSSSR